MVLPHRSSLGIMSLRFLDASSQLNDKTTRKAITGFLGIDLAYL